MKDNRQHKTDFDLQPWEILAYTYRDADSEFNGRVVKTKDFPSTIFLPYEGIEIQTRLS